MKAPRLLPFAGLFWGVWSGGTVGLLWGFRMSLERLDAEDIYWQRGGRTKQLERHDAVIVLL